jgi:hypothetical protein
MKAITNGTSEVHELRELEMPVGSINKKYMQKRFTEWIGECVVKISLNLCCSTCQTAER